MTAEYFFLQSDNDYNVGDTIRPAEASHFNLTKSPHDSLPSRVYYVEALMPVSSCATLRDGSAIATEGIPEIVHSSLNDAQAQNNDNPVVFMCSKVRILVDFDLSDEIDVILERMVLGPKAPAHAKALPSEEVIDCLIEDLPYQFVGVHSGRYLATCTSSIEGERLYAFIAVTHKRERDIRDLKMSIRQAFLFSGTPIFLTTNFVYFTLWSHERMGHQHVPRKGYRYYSRSKSREKSFHRFVAKKLREWNF